MQNLHSLQRVVVEKVVFKFDVYYRYIPDVGTY